ncbi:MAG: lytic transglycosylase domain-containing protein [Bacteroidetes bacterium]|nr:MAG: lytic transglycosylase domain-containing protein [Bacteroidota bacterium]
MKSLIFCLLIAPVYAQLPAPNWNDEMIEVRDDKLSGVLMSMQPIFDKNWNRLGQPVFWKKIMKLSPDTSVINVAATREVLMKIPTKEWKKMTDKQKDAIRDSLRSDCSFDKDERLMCTSGKNHFYKFDRVYPALSMGIMEFEKWSVDPWYAQAILLIESPGQLKRSNAGAYGAFQLMPGVARAQGLKVTKKLDERKDFKRSAYGAASLIRKICIPQAKEILDSHQIKYKESDLWFRLFVMHVYHAGANNVKAAVAAIQPKQGGQKLITQLWQTKAGKFGNASQNYTQVVLASQLILHDMVASKSCKLFDCQEASGKK